MKIRLLVIKNKIDYSIAQDIEKLKQWFLSIGIETDIAIKDSELPLYFKEFYGKMFGLDGIKEQLRDSLLVEPLTHNIVYFCYNAPQEPKGLTNWTYPNDLNGSAFCEIVYAPQFVGLNGDILIHETIHAFNRLLDWQGIRFIDLNDTPNIKREFIVETYKPFFGTMLKELPREKKIFIISGFLAFWRGIAERWQKDNLLALIKETAIKESVSDEVYKQGLATLKCESNLNPKARFVNTDGTIDRGIAQLNSKWYSHISDEDAYNTITALPIFWRQFKKRPQDWCCYTNGKFKQYL